MLRKIFIVSLLVLFLTIAVSPNTSTRAQSNTTYYITAATANARNCAQTTCRVVTKFSKGTAIQVTGTTEGSRFQGSTTWLIVDYDGQTVYVHSKLASTTAPASATTGGSSSSSGTSSGTSSSSSSSAAVCSCSSNSLNCSNFSTHSQAQSCFNYCVGQGRGDIHRLDADNDGVACESLP